jgi:hypothetical protein
MTTRIEEMGAGVELDALVDEMIFGRKWECHPKVKINGRWFEVPTWMYVGFSPDNPMAGCIVGCTPPAYSTSIESAWEVVGKLRQKYPIVNIRFNGIWCLVDLMDRSGFDDFVTGAAEGANDKTPA